MIIVIDFDGTIVHGDNWPGISYSQLLAKEVINSWKEDGCDIIINTCRSGQYEGMAEGFLREQGIAFDYINCNLPRMIVEYQMDCRKISGDVYIDDKNLGGLPEDWIEIDMMVRKHANYPRTTEPILEFVSPT